MSEPTRRVTFTFPDEVNEETIKNDKPAKIYYSSRTCWWTHRPEDLLPGTVPLDARGAPLFETDDVAGFMEAALSHPEHYGKHGLRAFWLSHAGNLRIIDQGVTKQWAFVGWQEYNDLIDKENESSTD